MRVSGFPAYVPLTRLEKAILGGVLSARAGQQRRLDEDLQKCEPSPEQVRGAGLAEAHDVVGPSIEPLCVFVRNTQEVREPAQRDGCRDRVDEVALGLSFEPIERLADDLPEVRFGLTDRPRLELNVHQVAQFGMTRRGPSGSAARAPWRVPGGRTSLSAEVPTAEEKISGCFETKSHVFVPRERPITRARHERRGVRTPPADAREPLSRSMRKYAWGTSVPKVLGSERSTSPGRRSAPGAGEAWVPRSLHCGHAWIPFRVSASVSVSVEQVAPIGRAASPTPINDRNRSRPRVPSTHRGPFAPSSATRPRVTSP